MNDARPTTHTNATRRDNRRFRTPSKPPVRLGEMTSLALIAVSAAILTGVLALPFAMPDRTPTEAETALGAEELGPPRACILPSA